MKIPLGFKDKYIKEKLLVNNVTLLSAIGVVREWSEIIVSNICKNKYKYKPIEFNDDLFCLLVCSNKLTKSEFTITNEDNIYTTFITIERIK